MTPVKFPGSNVIIGKDQDEYQNLPALSLEDKFGIVITCWELSNEELEELNQTKKIYLQQMTFGMLLQPVYISTSLADLPTL